MLKYFIIFIIILVVLDLILLIPIEARIVKRIEKPLLLKVLVFKKTIFQMELKKKAKPKQKSSFQFKISYLFENDLNIILKDLKEENFFVYLLLEFAKIKKVTFIPTFNSSDPIMMPYLGFLDWFIISNIKNYIDHTFHVVKDDYYQIVLLQDENQGINFEVYATVTLLEMLFAIIKNFKVFLKLFKKKENNIIQLLDISVDKIKSMVDVNVVMGKMMTYNNVSVIPISKVKCGFISGGVDQKENQETKKNPFGGASGGTMTLTPIAFLVILENDAKVLHLDEHSHILENLIDLIPDTINKFASLIKKDNHA